MYIVHIFVCPLSQQTTAGKAEKGVTEKSNKNSQQSSVSSSKQSVPVAKGKCKHCLSL